MLYKKLKKGKYDSFFENAIFAVLIFSILAFWYYLFFISDIFKDAFAWLDNFVKTKPKYAYLVAYLAAVAEGTIVLGMIPGTTFILTMGVFLSRGTVEAHILFPVVILGAFLGDLLGYSIGSFTKKTFVKSNIHNQPQFKIAEKFIEKHGSKSVFFARFISGIKELVPFIVGVLNMNMKKFMAYNFLGAVGWSFLWIGIGYVSGSFVKDAESIAKSVGLVFLIIFLIFIYSYYRKNIESFTGKKIK